ncbi:calmodulin-binding protein 60 D-like [Bidens hawaiensis]|uniref:calmodulin-binding protein 60 D-like n=1 Tax=Bidens hawaiensis TaxID=980011 RepID=UPI0040497D14
MEKHVQNLEYEEAFTNAKPMKLELTFLTKVASPVYTGRTITGEDGGNDGNRPINIMLVDSKTQQRVTNVQVASLKIKIVLIRAEFCGLNENKGIWTPQEFRNNIVINFGKKKNLLLGDFSLVLKGGSGTLGEIRIKHDRIPIRNVKFRLGAMVDGDCPYVIKEAITYPFDVKDRRNECKGTGPLLPNDMVWKMVNIAKKGPIHKRLERKNVGTVRNFLDMYNSNPQALKVICGMKGKRWDMTVSQAKTSLKNYVVYFTFVTKSVYGQYIIAFNCCTL